MGDYAVRRRLAQQVRWLFGGRITNDDFDDFYYDHCIDSDDPAVREIGRWAWTQYSSDTFAYRLRGWHAPDPDLRSTAVRAVVFLRNEIDYEWPSLREPMHVEWLRYIGSVGWLLTAGCLLVSLWNYGVTVGGVMLGPLFLILTSVVAAACFGSNSYARRLMQPRLDAFAAAGEQSCWPFANNAQLADARQRGHLLAP